MIRARLDAPLLTSEQNLEYLCGFTTRFEPGMVLTVEPTAMYGRGRIPVHEENALVTEDGPRLLTRRAPREMPVLTL